LTATNIFLTYIYTTTTNLKNTPLHTPHTVAFKSYLNTKHQQNTCFATRFAIQALLVIP